MVHFKYLVWFIIVVYRHKAKVIYLCMVANGVNAQKGMVLFKTVRHNFTVLRLELIMTDVQVQ